MNPMQFGKTGAPLKKGGALIWSGILIVIAVVAGFWYYSTRHDSGSLFEGLGPAASTTLTTASSTIPKKVAALTAPGAVRKVSTVVKVTESLKGASQFISLFKSTGVAEQITGKGPYTIFVPTNGAFSQLPSGTISKMTAAQKIRFVRYHVVAGRAIDPQAQIAGTIQALSGDALNFSYGADKIPLVGSAIFIKKYQASNGVVYLIDNVLLPPQR